MANEKIEVFYQPLLVGYHETLVYTDTNGQQFIATAGPTQEPDINPYTFSQGASAAANGTSSVWGTLGTTVVPISSLSQTAKDRLLGPTGNPNPSEVVASGTDLSQKWNTIVQTEQQIANQGLPYSPVTQNSNSVASAALTAAGIAPPTDNGLGSDHWAPAADNLLNVLPPATTPTLEQLFPLLDALDTLHKGYYDNGTQCVPISDAAYAQLEAAIYNNSTYRIAYLSCPLVLDLDDDGIETVASNGYAGALFDHNADGIRTATGWVKSDDGILVRDVNGNGTIDDGSEFFGDSTVLAAGGKAANGFAALADMDSNGDGIMNAADANFAQLQIWRDLNQNGASDVGEFFSLGQLGIQSINTVASDTTPIPVVGGIHSGIGSYTRTDGTVGSVADIYFTQDNFHSRYTTQITVPAELQNLPNVSGVGRLRDLQQAAAISPALVDALEFYGAATTSTERKALLGQVLIEWSKTDPLYSASPVVLYANPYQTYDPNSTNVIYLRFGESLPVWNGIGEPASQDVVDKVRVVDAIRGGAITTSLYGSNPAQWMIDAYNAIADSLYISLEQTRLKPLFDQIGIKFDGGGFSFDLSGVQTGLENRITLDAPSGVSDLLSFNRIVTAQGLLKGTDWSSRELGLLDSSITSAPMTSGLLAVLNDYGYGAVVTAQAGLITSGTAQTELIIGTSQGDVLNGGGGNDVLLGGVGDDTINAGTGNDIISGGDGNDTITGGDGNDTIYGGDGNDTITDSDGSDLIEGGAGDDVITDSGGGNNVLRGGDGNDTVISSYYSSNTVEGGAGNDLITVDTQFYSNYTLANTFAGGAGNDRIQAAGGADTYLFNRGDGQDTINDYGIGYYYGFGAAGLDQLVFGAGIAASDLTVSRSGNDLIININDPANPLATDRITIEDWDSGTYRIEQIQFADGTVLTAAQLSNLTMMGTDAADTLALWSDAIWTDGKGGNDTINSGYNDATIYGGDGNDTITDSDGSDLIEGGAGDDVITDSGGGNNVLRGGDGNDTVISSYYSSNTVEGGAGNDLITVDTQFYSNYTLANTFAGGAGNDRIQAAGGADTYLFNRGDGQDTINDYGIGYYYGFGAAGLDQLVFGAGIAASDLTVSRSGNDLIININDPANPLATDQITIEDWDSGTYRIEQIQFADGTVLTAAQLSNLTMMGTDAADTLALWSDAIWTDGKGGNDTINSGYNDATIYGGDGNDTITDSDGSDLIEGGAGDDVITDSGGGNNVLRGGDGNDTVISSYYSSNTVEGGAGNDLITVDTQFYSNYTLANTFAGGAGNDRIQAAGGADTYLFNRGDGQDTINDYGIGYYYGFGAAGLDQLVFGAGIAASDLTVSRSGDNLVIKINDPANPAATDQITVENWFASDAYQIESIAFADGTSITKAQLGQMAGTAGDDNLVGTAYGDTLAGLDGNDVLNGNAGNDILQGGNGSDTLNGGTGTDTMVGGLGDDTYTVDNIGDSVTENSDEGTDLVKSSATYTLSANVENITLTGTTAINGSGNAQDNILTGNSAANTLTGGDGSDTLNGGAGTDTLIGGLGNDTYTVDNVSDIVTENLNEGADMVKSSVTYTLAANVENLTLTGTTAINGTGNAQGNIFTGNSAINTLTGGDGNDTLNGAAGADKLLGGLGDDTYVVDNTGDVITESLNEGIDSVQSSITYTLDANVENLKLTGTTAINGTDNTLNNLLNGNTANNTLTAGTGNDIVQGGAGNDIVKDTAGSNLLDGGQGTDTITGAAGNEMFVGGAGNDTITTGNGFDIIVFNRGDGQDIVNGGVGTDNTLSLGGGIQYTDLALSKTGNNLILEVGNNEQITLKNWYDTAANYKSVLDLQVMADAMSAFDSASPDPLLNKAIQQFDFTAIANSFDTARGANATFMHWSALNTLLPAHLSGSDSAAFGGDLAHQYGKNGTLVGMNLGAAQSAIDDPLFGAQAQTLHPLQGLQGGAQSLG